MNVHDLVRAMEAIAPLHLAEPWDRVGLLVGDEDRPLAGPVVLTIDLTERVLAEAAGQRASAIVAYHPPIWEPLARLTAASARGRILLRAIESGMAVYCPHTALDAAEGGVTDWLCEGLSRDDAGAPGKIAGDCRALAPAGAPAGSPEVKIVTFVPLADVDKVRGALASAGAGIIGGYSACSFGVEGTGTFLGDQTTSPVVGERGRFEKVHEIRLEMVCSQRALALALETLRQFHPYEEPAIDVYELVAKPRRGAGAGRRLTLDRPATLADLARRLKSHLGHARVQVASAAGEGRLDAAVTTVGVVPGAGGSMLGLARSEKCEVFVTGEMKHHDVLEALHSGMSVILAGHTNTERGYLARLAGRLRGMLDDGGAGVTVHPAREDRDPLVIV